MLKIWEKKCDLYSETYGKWPVQTNCQQTMRRLHLSWIKCAVLVLRLEHKFIACVVAHDEAFSFLNEKKAKKVEWPPMNRKFHWSKGIEHELKISITGPRTIGPTAFRCMGIRCSRRDFRVVLDLTGWWKCQYNCNATGFTLGKNASRSLWEQVWYSVRRIFNFLWNSVLRRECMSLARFFSSFASSPVDFYKLQHKFPYVCGTVLKLEIGYQSIFLMLCENQSFFMKNTHQKEIIFHVLTLLAQQEWAFFVWDRLKGWIACPNVA